MLLPIYCFNAFVAKTHCFVSLSKIRYFAPKTDFYASKNMYKSLNYSAVLAILKPPDKMVTASVR